MSDVYNVKKVREGLTVIEEENVRMFLIEGTERALLIDTGNGGGDLKSLVESLTDKPLTVAISHADSDHTSACEQFKEVYMHPSDFALYRRDRHEGVSLLPLYEGDEIDLGGRVLEVVFIPGHTPGSIAFLNGEERYIITGDTVCDGPIYMFGDARSMEAYVTSVEYLIDLQEEYDTIYCSHHSLEQTAEILPELIEGACEVFAGNVEGFDVDLGWAQPKQYNYKDVKFYF